MSLRSNLGALVQRHQRVVGIGLVVTALALLGVAVLLGWMIFNGLPPTAQYESSSEPSSAAGATLSASAAPSELAPSAMPSTVRAPSVSPSVITGFEYSDILRVEVNQLAVRAAPVRIAPLLQGYRFDDVSAWVPVGEIRLNVGDFVRVHLGPLRIGDTVWYLVWAAQVARPYSPVSWSTSTEPTGNTEPGWVAASVGDQQYLTFDHRPDPREYDAWWDIPGGPHTLMVAGSGDYESSAQIRHDLYLFNWAIAVDDQLAPCTFTATLVPNGTDVEPVIAVDVTTMDVAQGPTQGEGAGLDTHWKASGGGTLDSFVVRIRSGCTWAIHLEPEPHD